MATVTAKQKASLTKKANDINKAFQKVKGSLSQSDRSSLGSSLTKANSAVSTLRKSSGSTSKSSGDRINESYDKALAEKNRAISPESFNDSGVVDIPKPAVNTTDFASILNVGNAGLTDTEGGLSYDGSQFNIQPTDSASVAAAKEANAGNAGVLNAVAQYLKPQENQFEDAYAQTLKESGLRKYERERDQYAAQLNAIVANRDASKLKLEGQGRGITDTIIGGQQARIDREAAIQALPIQAQLAAAQGAVDTAQKHLDTLFQVRSQDISAQNAYKTNLANSVMQYASQAQQNILNAKMSDIANQNATAQANLAYQRQLQGMALEFGQSGLINGISSIDPSSPDFEQQIAAYTAQLRKPVTTTTKAPTLQNFGTSDNPIWKQYDYATGEWVDVAGVAGASTPQQAVKLSMGQQQLDLIGSILGSNAMDSAVGTSIFSRGAGTTGGVMGRLLAGGAAGATVGATAGLAGGPLAPITSTMGAVGGGVIGAGLAALQGSKDTLITGERQNFIANVDQLTAKLTNAELIKAKAAGATYGALGVKEQQLLENAATKINNWAIHEGGDPEAPVIGYNTSEKNMKAELDNIAYYTKLDYVLSGGDPNIVGASQQPDGTWWIVNSDGSARQLQLEY